MHADCQALVLIPVRCARRRGYQIERHLSDLGELGACLKDNCPDPVPEGDEILIDVQSVLAQARLPSCARLPRARLECSP